MKRILLIVAVMLVFRDTGTGQSQELEQLILNVEKLARFKQILKDLEKSYAILSGGYNTIRDISQGNFNLHRNFLEGLLAVSPAVRKYRRTRDIIHGQILLAREAAASLNRFRKDPQISPEELNYMGRVYYNLFRESIHNLDALAMVVTAGKMRMSDAERLDAIDRIYRDMETKLSFLHDFNAGAGILSLQRGRASAELGSLGAAYGIK